MRAARCAKQGAGVKPKEFKERVAAAFDDLLPFYRTMAEQSRFLDGVVLGFVPPHCRHAGDLGCGYGELALKLSASCASVTGYDISPRMVREARERLGQCSAANVEFIEGDCEESLSTFEDIDFVVCVRSVHYFDIPELLQRIRETARPGARVLIVGVSRKYHAHPLLNLFLEAVFYLVHPGVLFRFLKRFGLRLFLRIHAIKFRMDRSPIWRKHIDELVFGGMLETFPMYAKLYLDLLPGSSVERVTVREFIVKWEKTDSAA